MTDQPSPEPTPDFLRINEADFIAWLWARWTNFGLPAPTQARITASLTHFPGDPGAASCFAELLATREARIREEGERIGSEKACEAFASGQQEGIVHGLERAAQMLEDEGRVHTARAIRALAGTTETPKEDAK